jgi:DNA (cytosine-5)-methyltransferase 1
MPGIQAAILGESFRRSLLPGMHAGRKPLNYYNEFDPHAAQWLRNLIGVGLIPPGHVDERSIKEVKPDDLIGYNQCHFFAGIGGWPLALQFAGWPTDRPVWTGSCPCQPFSCSGKKKGFADERHLWPELYRLVGECKPAIAFGEQVASKDGRLWLSGVRDDLEALAYEVGAADLCAAGIASPHIRQRIYWMAYTPQVHDKQGGKTPEQIARRLEFERSLSACGLAVAESQRHDGSETAAEPHGRIGLEGRGAASPGWLGDSSQPGLQRHAGNVGNGNKSGRIDSQSVGPTAAPNWDDYRVLKCTDGKSRRASSQPDSFPLVDGIPRKLGHIKPELHRMGINLKSAKANRTIRLKGYGNAIVPPLAAEFILAGMEAIGE